MAVGAARRRPVPGARRVAPVGGEPTGEPGRQPVVREHNVGQPLPRVRLVPAQPRELGDREARHRNEPAGVGPGRPAPGQLLDQPRRVRGRLGVVPQLGGADDAVVRIEGHHAVLLPGHADRRHLGRSRLTPGGLERRPPGGRVLLGPWGAGRRMRRRAAAHDPPAVEVAHLDLRGRRGRVDAGDKCCGHERPPVRPSQTCRWRGRSRKAHPRIARSPRRNWPA